MTNLKPIMTQQKHFMRLITGKHKREHSWPLFVSKKILPLRNLFIYKVLKLFYDRSGNLPLQTNLDFKSKLRNANNVVVPKPENTFFTKTFDFLGPRIFNKLPDCVKSERKRYIFHKKTRDWLVDFEHVDCLLNIVI
jgi:hypothetical protein